MGSAFAPADGRLAWPPQSASGSGGHAPWRRRERPVSGRLDDVRKVLTDLILDPAAGRLNEFVRTGVVLGYGLTALRCAANDAVRLSSAAFPFSAVPSDGRPITPLVV